MADLLASEEVLRIMLGEDEDEFDLEKATRLLRISSGEVRAATGQLFDLVEDEEIILNGTGSRTLLLPQLPVVEISELFEAQGTTNEVELVGPSGDSPEFEWSTAGIIRRLPAGAIFSSRYRWYRGKYTHGYADTPDDVAGVVLRMAARAYTNPDGLRQETMGRYSYTIAGENAGVGLLDADRVALSAYMPDSTTQGFTGTPAEAS